ncbi:hypothetical protein LCGC14_0753960 [marine sediment metagenome]|uniref:Alpha/beta hydrolase n=2 Tax=root TaxID=1 RepID=A0A831QR99_9FLAO|nr:alpha/beta hydrolase [Pricia sp.]HEA23225.1 alpha/beta hydrolase [Pricia antarctica]
MKKWVFCIFVAFTFTNFLQAQDITGKWHGLLEIPGSPLRLVLNIQNSVDGYSSTLDSPDQGAMGIPVDITTFADGNLSIAVTVLGLTYTAELKGNTFYGGFAQGGFNLPLEMSRKPIEKPTQKRPQEPIGPFAYYSESVSFKNLDAGIELAGTLTLPDKTGKHPVAILISGSGPHNRNAEIAGHKPFLLIADFLTRNGIGVLRFDDRGVGESKGDFKMATSEDFASDVHSALNFLTYKDGVDKDNIGLIGHSEGGVIAPMVAARNGKVSFIVLLAGTGLPGYDILEMQGELIGKASGQSDVIVEQSAAIRRHLIEMALASENIPTLRTNMTAYLNQEFQNQGVKSLLPEGANADQFIKGQVDFMATPWMHYFLRHDPVKILEMVNCPVLAINGENDLQVPPEENLSAIRDALIRGGNSEVTIQVLSGLNHLFQESETGLPSAYGSIEQTFSPIALDVITEWISHQVK